ncbi:hypothetical protein AAMO2058_000466900 [Amorphochlora amoebiformis]|eukprot:1325536-Amorphochlora_amoeboformis.AAC.1
MEWLDSNHTHSIKPTPDHMPHYSSISHANTVKPECKYLDGYKAPPSSRTSSPTPKRLFHVALNKKRTAQEILEQDSGRRLSIRDFIAIDRAAQTQFNRRYLSSHGFLKKSKTKRLVKSTGGSSFAVCEYDYQDEDLVKCAANVLLL